MRIGSREINNLHPPFIVAEISGNHGGSLYHAKQLIKAAKRAGADAVKTQCYEPGTITLPCNNLDFIIQDGLWAGKTLHQLYETAHTPFAWHPELYKLAQDLEIIIFSSVFDRSSIEYLERLGCPAYKIASMEIIDTPLIRMAAATNKPLIISTGMASMREIQEADAAVGMELQAAFLHCTSEYPATSERADLAGIGRLKVCLPHRQIGISDHTVEHVVPVAATALGATIIEKHIRLKNTDSEDTSFSLDEGQFADMVALVKTAWEAMKEQELTLGPSRQLRRSLYAVEDIDEGEVFTEENIRSIRPGWGLPPKALPGLLGKKAKRRFKKGDRIR